MEITIRPERPEDYREVEELTREAFWNLHVPGCDEHLLAHRLRTSPAFIPELDFVAVIDGKVAGSIMYCRSKLLRPDGATLAVVTFGPLSVWPQLQKQGVGAALVRHSLGAAAKLHHRAVLIYGDPAYYRRFGFKGAAEFGIATREGMYMDALMALELAEGALTGMGPARFDEGEAYAVDPAETEAFDKSFPPKEKLVTETQQRFMELASQGKKQ